MKDTCLPSAGNRPALRDAASQATFESLEPRLLLNAATPDFVTPLPDYFAITAGGGGLTIGIDAYDADGDTTTITLPSFLK